MKACQNCGEMVPDTAKFCRSCGAPVGAAEPASRNHDPEDQTMLIPNEEPEPRMERPQPNRGYQQEPPQPNRGYQQEPAQFAPGYQAPPVSVWDHTMEHDFRDISENKAISMLPYLLGPLGLIVAMLKSGTSKFRDFHIHQGIKFAALDGIILVFAVLFIWMVPLGINGKINTAINGTTEGLSGGLFDVPEMSVGPSIPYQIVLIIYGILGVLALLLLILKIISAFSAGTGRAKEPAIVRSIGFLK